MLPNGDVATSNMAKSGTTFFFDAIDETIALTDNGTTLIRNSGTAGSSYLGAADRHARRLRVDERVDDGHPRADDLHRDANR